MKLLIEVLTAHGCGKCAKAGELIRSIIRNQKNVEFREIDITKQPEILQKYQIFSTPGIVMNGKLEFRGLPKEKELKAKIASYLKGE